MKRIGAVLNPLLWVVCLMGLSIAPVTADEGRLGDELYKPYVGQPGKDVIWVPTPDAMVDEMIQAAEVGPHDLVVDLGAGDGKIAIAAALRRGARAVGIEFDPAMAALAKRNAQRAGVSDRVTIVEGDLFKVDFSQATVVTMYLLPELNMRLKPILRAMRPGTRIVSHSFGMESWSPDRRIETANASGYLWIVPANFQGLWNLDLPAGRKAKLTLKQIHQQLSGSLELDGKTIPIEEGRVTGYGLTIQFGPGGGRPLSLRGQLMNRKISGELLEAGKSQLVDGSKAGN
jgi:SAM-dependent methyltransferase